jgi:beta-galactosidase
MKSLGLNLVRMGEFTWSRLEPDEGRVDLAFFRSLLDRLHAAGISVIFCTPSATPPVWLTHGHPERCFVDSEGRVMNHGARQHASYEHPEVRAACLRIVDAMAREFGRHPAVIGWQIDNEFKCHVGEDFNPHAIAKWRHWLERRYGMIDALNLAWGTEVWSERYQSFAQVPAPVRTPFLHNASLSTAWRMFSRESIAEFCAAQAEVIRRHSDRPITHNSARYFSVNFEQLFASLDFAAFDDYPDFANWSALVFQHDLFRALKPGRRHWLMETSVAHNGCLGNHEVVHPPGFLAAEVAASYALGAEGVNYWLWRQQRTGCELPHSAVMSAWFKPTLGHAEVARAEAARRELEPVLAGGRPEAAQVALTWSDLGKAMVQTEPLGARPGHAVDYDATLLRWHRLLLATGLPRDVRTEGAALEGLKVLITPMMPSFSSDFLSRVEQFVRAGGVWVCAPTTGTRTAEHSVPTEAGLGAIEPLAGIETVFSFPLTGTAATGTGFGHTVPLAGWCSALRATAADTRVLGTLQSVHTPGLALLTERQVGAGAVLVLGAMPEGEAGDAFLGDVVRYALERAGLATVQVTPGTLVCPWRTADGERVSIAVNLDGAGGRLADGSTLAPYAWRVVRGG